MVDSQEDARYRVCKEKLNSLVKLRGEEKRDFEASLKEFQPSLYASLRMASGELYQKWFLFTLRL